MARAMTCMVDVSVFKLQRVTKTQIMEWGSDFSLALFRCLPLDSRRWFNTMERACLITLH